MSGARSSSQARTPNFVNYGAQAPSPYNGRNIAQRQFQLGGLPMGTNMLGQPRYSQTGYNMTYTQRPPIQQQQYIRPAQQQQTWNNGFFGLSNPYGFMNSFSPYGFQSPYQSNWYGGTIGGPGQGGM